MSARVVTAAGGFLLRCGSIENDDGRFIPTLRIFASAQEEGAPGFSVPMHQAPLFESSELASRHAEVEGLAWAADRA